jgi:hypothetical protein
MMKKQQQKKRINKVLRSFIFNKNFHTGKVLSVKDGVAKGSGLFGVLSGEMGNLGSNSSSIEIISKGTTGLANNNSKIISLNDYVTAKSNELEIKRLKVGGVQRYLTDGSIIELDPKLCKIACVV